MPKIIRDIYNQLKNDEIVKVIFSEIKKRKEAIFQFEKGKREDLVNKEKKEIEILKKYLPKLLSEKEIEEIVKEIIKKLKANEIKDMQRVMREVMAKVRGRAEGEEVAKVVKKLLTRK